MEATIATNGTGTLSHGAMIRHLEGEILRLQGELSMIALQLGDPDRLDPKSGEPLTVIEHRRWKRKALYARALKERELRALKERRRDLLRAGQEYVTSGSDELLTHTLRLYKILREIAADGALEPGELDVLHDAQAYFQRTYGDNALGGAVQKKKGT